MLPPILLSRSTAFAIAALLALSACSGTEQATTGTNPDSVRVGTGAASAKQDTASADKSDAQKEVIIGQTTWEYEKRMDAEAGTTYKASITSPTQLQFGFPYEGGSAATLTIRKRDRDDATVYLQVSRGQFNKSFQGGTARISFNGEAPKTYTYSAAANGSATVIFFDAADALIRQLKTARNAVIDVAFSNQGNRKIEFRTAGLRWNH